MSIENIKKHITLQDIKLNLSNVLSEAGSPELTTNQIGGVALAVAYASKNTVIIQSILAELSGIVIEEEINAAKSAAVIMAMNNIYYRFLHLVSDNTFAAMPAKLRMNTIRAPGIRKIDFELYCLAVSAVNGCGMCIDAHINELIKAGVSKLAIQSAIRIASVLNAVAMEIAVNQTGDIQ